MKKQKYKILAVLAAMTLSMAGCAKEKAPTVTEPTTTVETTTEIETTQTETETETNETIPTKTMEPEAVETETLESETTIADELPTAIQELDKTMYATQSCSVRTAPNNTATKMYSLAKNDKVHVIGQDLDSKWYLLEDGYFVAEKYVTTVAPKENATTTTPATTTPSTTTKPSTTTPSTTTPSSSAPSTGSESTGETTTTVCQHKNTGRLLLDTTISCTTTRVFKVVCDDCGATVNDREVETTPRDHLIKETIIFDQNWICGSQDEYTHIHYQCDCGEVNYDGPSELTRSKEHSLVTFQLPDDDGNVWETTYCRFCPYKIDPFIVSYASGD